MECTHWQQLILFSRRVRCFPVQIVFYIHASLINGALESFVFNIQLVDQIERWPQYDRVLIAASVPLWTLPAGGSGRL